MNRSAVLLSGGMDSFALTYERRPSLAVTVDYGQAPAAAEIKSAKTLTNELGIDHEVVTVDLAHLGSGDLCAKPAIELAPVSEWWPFRNQALITIAAMKVVNLGVKELMIASVNSDDAHADGSHTFISKLDQLLAIQEGGMRVSAPAIGCTTTELIRRSGIPLSLLAWSHSCHTGNLACAHCRGCFKSRAVWEALEVDVDR